MIKTAFMLLVITRFQTTDMEIVEFKDLKSCYISKQYIEKFTSPEAKESIQIMCVEK